jgi:IS30 family transposase
MTGDAGGRNDDGEQLGEQIGRHDSTIASELRRNNTQAQRFC